MRLELLKQPSLNDVMSALDHQASVRLGQEKGSLWKSPFSLNRRRERKEIHKITSQTIESPRTEPHSAPVFDFIVLPGVGLNEQSIFKPLIGVVRKINSNSSNSSSTCYPPKDNLSNVIESTRLKGENPERNKDNPERNKDNPERNKDNPESKSSLNRSYHEGQLYRAETTPRFTKILRKSFSWNSSSDSQNYPVKRATRKTLKFSEKSKISLKRSVSENGKIIFTKTATKVTDTHIWKHQHCEADCQSSNELKIHPAVCSKAKATEVCLEIDTKVSPNFQKKTTAFQISCPEDFDLLFVTYGMEDHVASSGNSKKSVVRREGPEKESDPIYKCAYEFASQRGYGFVEFVEDQSDSRRTQRFARRRKLLLELSGKDDRVNPVTAFISSFNKSKARREMCTMEQRIRFFGLSDWSTAECDEVKMKNNEEAEKVKAQSPTLKTSCPNLMKENSPQRNRHRIHSKTRLSISTAGAVKTGLESPEDVHDRRDDVTQSASLNDVKDNLSSRDQKGKRKNCTYEKISTRSKSIGVGDVLSTPKTKSEVVNKSRVYRNKSLTCKAGINMSEEVKKSELTVNHSKKKMLNRKSIIQALDTNTSKKYASESDEMLWNMFSDKNAADQEIVSESKTDLPLLTESTSLQYKMCNSLSATIFRETQMTQKSFPGTELSDKLTTAKIDVVYFAHNHTRVDDSACTISIQNTTKTSSNAYGRMKPTQGVTEARFRVNNTGQRGLHVSEDTTRGCSKWRTDKQESLPSFVVHKADEDKIQVSKSLTISEMCVEVGDSLAKSERTCRKYDEISPVYLGDGLGCINKELGLSLKLSGKSDEMIVPTSLPQGREQCQSLGCCRTRLCEDCEATEAYSFSSSCFRVPSREADEGEMKENTLATVIYGERGVAKVGEQLNNNKNDCDRRDASVGCGECSFYKSGSVQSKTPCCHDPKDASQDLGECSFSKSKLDSSEPPFYEDANNSALEGHIQHLHAHIELDCFLCSELTTPLTNIHDEATQNSDPIPQEKDPLWAQEACSNISEHNYSSNDCSHETTDLPFKRSVSCQNITKIKRHNLFRHTSSTHRENNNTDFTKRFSETLEHLPDCCQVSPRRGIRKTAAKMSSGKRLALASVKIVESRDQHVEDVSDSTTESLALGTNVANRSFSIGDFYDYNISSSGSIYESGNTNVREKSIEGGITSTRASRNKEDSQITASMEIFAHCGQDKELGDASKTEIFISEEVKGSELAENSSKNKMIYRENIIQALHTNTSIQNAGNSDEILRSIVARSGCSQYLVRRFNLLDTDISTSCLEDNHASCSCSWGYCRNPDVLDCNLVPSVDVSGVGEELEGGVVALEADSHPPVSFICDTLEGKQLSALYNSTVSSFHCQQQHIDAVPGVDIDLNLPALSIKEDYPAIINYLSCPSPKPIVTDLINALSPTTDFCVDHGSHDIQTERGQIKMKSYSLLRRVEDRLQLEGGNSRSRLLPTIKEERTEDLVDTMHCFKTCSIRSPSSSREAPVLCALSISHSNPQNTSPTLLAIQKGYNLNKGNNESHSSSHIFPSIQFNEITTRRQRNYFLSHHDPGSNILKRIRRCYRKKIVPYVMKLKEIIRGHKQKPRQERFLRNAFRIKNIHSSYIRDISCPIIYNNGNSNNSNKNRRNTNQRRRAIIRTALKLRKSHIKPTRQKIRRTVYFVTPEGHKLTSENHTSGAKYTIGPEGHKRLYQIFRKRFNALHNKVIQMNNRNSRSASLCQSCNLVSNITDKFKYIITQFPERRLKTLKVILQSGANSQPGKGKQLGRGRKYVYSNVRINDDAEYDYERIGKGGFYMKTQQEVGQFCKKRHKMRRSSCTSMGSCSSVSVCTHGKVKIVDSLITARNRMARKRMSKLLQNMSKNACYMKSSEAKERIGFKHGRKHKGVTFADQVRPRKLQDQTSEAHAYQRRPRVLEDSHSPVHAFQRRPRELEDSHSPVHAFQCGPLDLEDSHSELHDFQMRLRKLKDSNSEVHAFQMRPRELEDIVSEVHFMQANKNICSPPRKWNLGRETNKESPGRSSKCIQRTASSTAGSGGRADDVQRNYSYRDGGLDTHGWIPGHSCVPPSNSKASTYLRCDCLWPRSFQPEHPGESFVQIDDVARGCETLNERSSSPIVSAFKRQDRAGLVGQTIRPAQIQHLDKAGTSNRVDKAGSSNRVDNSWGCYKAPGIVGSKFGNSFSQNLSLNREQRITYREQSTAEREHSTAERAQRAADRERSTADREQSTADRAQRVANREHSAANREQSTANREQITADREQSTADRAQRVANREQSTADREQSTADRAQRVANREHSAADREQSTADREQSTADREQMTADTTQMPDRSTRVEQMQHLVRMYFSHFLPANESAARWDEKGGSGGGLITKLRRPEMNNNKTLYRINIANFDAFKGESLRKSNLQTHRCEFESISRPRIAYTESLYHIVDTNVTNSAPVIRSSHTNGNDKTDLNTTTNHSCLQPPRVFGEFTNKDENYTSRRLKPAKQYLKVSCSNISTTWSSVFPELKPRQNGSQGFGDMSIANKGCSTLSIFSTTVSGVSNFSGVDNVALNGDDNNKVGAAIDAGNVQRNSSKRSEPFTRGEDGVDKAGGVNHRDTTGTTPTYLDSSHSVASCSSSSSSSSGECSNNNNTNKKRAAIVGTGQESGTSRQQSSAVTATRSSDELNTTSTNTHNGTKRNLRDSTTRNTNITNERRILERERSQNKIQKNNGGSGHRNGHSTAVSNDNVPSPNTVSQTRKRRNKRSLEETPPASKKKKMS